MKGLLADMWDNRESVVGGLFNMFSNKKESKLGDDFKYSLLARNFIPDIKEGADELKTIIDNPRVAAKSALELVGGAIGKLTPDFIDQGLLKIAPNNLITSENTSQMASDAYEDIKKNLGSIDAVKKTIQDNPFDTLLAASGIGAVANQVRKASTPTLKKALAQAEANGLMDEIRKVGSTPVGLSMKDVSNSFPDPTDAYHLEQVRKHRERGDPMIVQHNLREGALMKHAEASGIPMPSLAISKVDKPLRGFGDISLLGSADMITPSATTKVYPTDMYSGRAPEDRIEYTNVEGVLDMVDPDKLRFFANNKPADNPNKLYSGGGINRGMTNREYINDKSRRDFALAPHHTGSLERQIATVDEAIRRGFDPYKYPTYREAIGDINNTLHDQGNPLLKAISSDDIPREGLLGETRRTMVNPKGSRTPTGLHRPDIPYSAEDALKVMRRKKSQLPGAENYESINQTVALAGTPFKNLAEIKKNRGLLEDSRGISDGDSLELFELDIERVKKELHAITGYVSGDNAIEQVLRTGSFPKDTYKYYNLEPETARKAEKIILSLRDKNKQLRSDDFVRDNPELSELTRTSGLLSTEYFEAKPNRIIDIAEFKGAIIPNDTKPEIIKLLKDKGIKKILSYGSQAQRLALYKNFPELNFIALAIPTNALMQDEDRKGLLL